MWYIRQMRPKSFFLDSVLQIWRELFAGAPTAIALSIMVIAATVLTPLGLIAIAVLLFAG